MKENNMEVIYEKNGIKLTNSKAYALVYEKSYSQGSSSSNDEFEVLVSEQDYERAFKKLNEAVINVDNDSEKENENDEYSKWYSECVRYRQSKVIDVCVIYADFKDFEESVRVITFDIDISEIDPKDIEGINITKHCNHRFVSERKKELVIKTKDNEFCFSY